MANGTAISKYIGRDSRRNSNELDRTTERLTTNLRHAEHFAQTKYRQTKSSNLWIIVVKKCETLQMISTNKYGEPILSVQLWISRFYHEVNLALGGLLKISKKKIHCWTLSTEQLLSMVFRRVIIDRLWAVSPYIFANCCSIGRSGVPSSFREAADISFRTGLLTSGTH